MEMENRKRFIREVLDEDMNMKQRVVDLNRYRVMGMVEEVTPYVQIDQVEIEKMRAAAATLSQVLEKKALLANQIRDATDDGKSGNASVIDLAHTEEVLAAYNAVVTIYLNPRNTQETKSYISQILTSFEGKVSEIHDNMQGIIAELKQKRRPHVEPMIYAFSLFGLLLDQLSSNNFHVIYMSDLRVANELRQKDTGQVQPAAAPRPAGFNRVLFQGDTDDEDDDSMGGGDGDDGMGGNDPTGTWFKDDRTPQSPANMPGLGQPRVRVREK